MSWHIFTRFAAVGALAATLFVAPTVWAQHHGGGHGSGHTGGHGGHGGHVGGGGHAGGHVGHVGSTAHFHGGGGRAFVPRTGGARFTGYGGRYYGGYSPYRSYGYNRGYGSYGYYPSYGTYGAYWPYYGGNYANYYSNNYYYSPGAYDYPYGYDYPAYDTSYVPPVVASNAPLATVTTALVTVEVPDGAEVWFGDVRMAQTGSVRQFVSPSLNPGMEYSYDIRARWMEGGSIVERSRHVTIHAGDQITVDFMHG